MGFDIRNNWPRAFEPGRCEVLPRLTSPGEGDVTPSPLPFVGTNGASKPILPSLNTGSKIPILPFDTYHADTYQGDMYHVDTIRNHPAFCDMSRIHAPGESPTSPASVLAPRRAVVASTALIRGPLVHTTKSVSPRTKSEALLPFT